MQSWILWKAAKLCRSAQPAVSCVESDNQSEKKKTVKFNVSETAQIITEYIQHCHCVVNIGVGQD